MALPIIDNGDLDSVATQKINALITSINDMTSTTTTTTTAALVYNDYNFGPDRAGTCAGSYGTKSIGVVSGDTIGTASIIYGSFIAMGGAGATFYVKFNNGGTDSTRGFVIDAGLATATPSQPIVAC